jgi:hypothetical protein
MRLSVYSVQSFPNGYLGFSESVLIIYFGCPIIIWKTSITFRLQQIFYRFFQQTFRNFLATICANFVTLWSGLTKLWSFYVISIFSALRIKRFHVLCEDMKIATIWNRGSKIKVQRSLQAHYKDTWRLFKSLNSWFQIAAEFLAHIFQICHVECVWNFFNSLRWENRNYIKWSQLTKPDHNVTKFAQIALIKIGDSG